MVRSGICTIHAIRYSGNVKEVWSLLAGLCVVATVLDGCGSSSPPVLTMSCVTRALPKGMERVKVHVTNTTGVTRTAVLYGPAIVYVRHEYPVLRPKVLNGAGHVIGLVVPNVKPHATTTVLLRFQQPPQAKRLAVADSVATRTAPKAGVTACKVQATGQKWRSQRLNPRARALANV
jgi:hypothetical protein